MDVKNDKVFIQPTGTPRQQLYMLQKQSHAVSTAACSISDYDYHIYNDSISHARETDTDDEEAKCARYHDRSAAHIQACMYGLHESHSVSTNAAHVIADEGTIFTE